MRLRKHKRNVSQRKFSARLCTACRRTVLLLCVVPERRNVRTGVPRLRCGGAQWTAALVHTGGVLTAYAVSAERRPSVEVPTGTYRALCGQLIQAVETQWSGHTRALLEQEEDGPIDRLQRNVGRTRVGVEDEFPELWQRQRNRLGLYRVASAGGIRVASRCVDT